MNHVLSFESLTALLFNLDVRLVLTEFKQRILVVNFICLPKHNEFGMLKWLRLWNQLLISALRLGRSLAIFLELLYNAELNFFDILDVCVGTAMGNVEHDLKEGGMILAFKMLEKQVEKWPL